MRKFSQVMQEILRKRIQSITLWYIFSYSVLLILSFITIIPVVWMLVTSLKDRREVFSSFLPSSPTISNYVRIWTEYNLSSAFINSILVTVCTVFIMIIVSTLSAYVFAEIPFRGRNIIFYACIISIMIPKHALLIPMFIFIKDIGLINTLVGLSTSFLGIGVSFSIFIMRVYFSSLPTELGDAGRIDGCSEFDVFFKIYLPLARPGIATIAIFQFVDVWNELLFSTTFIFDPHLKTLQPGITQVVGRYSSDYPALTAGLIIGLLPMIIVFFFMQKQFVRGLTAGALR